MGCGNDSKHTLVAPLLTKRIGDNNRIVTNIEIERFDVSTDIN